MLPHRKAPCHNKNIDCNGNDAIMLMQSTLARERQRETRPPTKFAPCWNATIAVLGQRLYRGRICCKMWCR